MAFAKIPECITTKDEYDTSIGKLRFFDGLPDEATIQKVYDNLDRSRAMHAFLDMIPLASIEAMRAGFVEIGCDACHKVILFGDLMDSHSLFLTGNTDTVYVASILNLGEDGPAVIEVPGGAGPGTVNDAYFRFVCDMGKPGPDKGAGGKYLIIPPGYDGQVPDGYFVFHSPTFTNFVVNRGFLKDGKPDFSAALWRDGLKIYPLKSASNPPKMEFLNVSGKSMNTIHSNDFGFFNEVNDVIQREPIEFLDPELRGNLAAIGIRKGEPFNPSEHMKTLLTEGVVLGNATARALSFAPRHPETRLYGEESEWSQIFVGGYQWLVDEGCGGRHMDGRTRFFYQATLNTPAMVLKLVGVGSQYAGIYRDENHQYLDGGKCYSLTLPPNVPAKDFWSVVVYDAQTRSMLQTEQVSPGRNSVRHPDMKANSDGSTTLWFGPSAPGGKATNWIQTIPGKTWFLYLRLYGPGEAWFDKSWKPGELREESAAMAEQTERAYQKQAPIFQNKKRILGQQVKKDKKELRYVRNVGLGFKTPKEAIEGTYIDKKCPFTGNVSIRGRILTGIVASMKMKRTIVIRRDYLHHIKKYNRFEKRHKNLSAHLSPCFRDVSLGDVVTVGQCRPLSKTVRFNVLKVSKGKGSKDKKQFEKF